MADMGAARVGGFLIFLWISAVSGLSCEQCALATFSTTNPVVAADIVDSARNTRMDVGCDTWGTPIGNSVTCSVDNVKLGKASVGGATEGTDFIYRCATMNVTLQYDFDFEGQSGDDLVMATKERGCVAVPPASGFTQNACYDYASNVFLMSVIEDIDSGVSYATAERFASDATGDNVVCFCTTDNCNTVDSNGVEVVEGVLAIENTTTAAVANVTTDSGRSGTTVGRASVLATCLLGLVSLVAIL